VNGNTLRGLLTALAAMAWGLPAEASENDPGLSPRALPGVVEVGLPAPAPHGFSLGASFGAGWIDPIGAPPVEAARLGGSIAAAYSPLPALAFGLDFSGHADWLSTPEENATSEPRLTLRALVLPSGPVRLGLEGDVRFVGTTAPSIDWAATSPSLSALVACTPAPGTWLGGTLGFHLDRSAEAVPDPSAVSPADRITLGASSAPAVRVGLGVTHELEAAKIVLLGEVSADLLVFDSAPPLEQSPMRLSAGARYQLSPGLSLLAIASAGLSARPGTLAGDTLQPIEPRLGGQLALTWTIQPEEHEPAPAAVAPAAAPPPPPPPPAPARSPVRGRVVDEAGQGLPDVEVTLELSTETLSIRTAADGSFEFPEIEDGAAGRVRASASGYDPAVADLPPARDRQKELVLYSAVPAGQVRGTIVDLQGRPVAAKITIDPGNQVLEVPPDGTFNIELKPGEYRLRAEHPDFSPQGRVIVVVERGVVILHIALTP
jgi:hypothetical protein